INPPCLGALLQRDSLVIHNFTHEALPHIAPARQERLHLVTEIAARQVAGDHPERLDNLSDAGLGDAAMPLRQRLDVVEPPVVVHQDPEVRPGRFLDLLETLRQPRTRVELLQHPDEVLTRSLASVHGTGRARRRRAPPNHRLEKQPPLRGQQLAAQAEELAIDATLLTCFILFDGTEVLERPERHDSVERAERTGAALFPVLQVHLEAVAAARLEVLRAQRETHAVPTALLDRLENRSPAAPDVEHTSATTERQIPEDVVMLVVLRSLQWLGVLAVVEGAGNVGRFADTEPEEAVHVVIGVRHLCSRGHMAP